MKCAYEEEDKACGRKEGIWEGIGNLTSAILNKEYTNKHMKLSPYQCSLGLYDMRELVKLLSGGRVLRLRGDSTMRQLYNGIVCSIPDDLIKTGSGELNKYMCYTYCLVLNRNIFFLF